MIAYHPSRTRKPHQLAKFNLLSYGGGIQSVAMVLLVASGKLPRPDAIVMADTGREKTSTWEYLEQYIQPLLASKGAIVEIAPHSFATVDLFSLSTGRILMPMYTTKKSDVMPDAEFIDGHGRKVAKLPTYCSGEWKRSVVQRYLRDAYNIRPKQTITWFGFSLDETRRMRSNPDRQAFYPLIESYPVTRDDCKRYIIESGLPLPQKSACWMCPHMNDAEWLAMKASHPQDFASAVKLENELRQKDSDVWFHRSAISLSQVEFDESTEQLESQCGLGMCMI